jgi:hypothetical protein
MLSEMARQQPRVGIVTAARRRTDNDRDRLAAIELRGRILRYSRQSPATGPKCHGKRGDFPRHGPSSLDLRASPLRRRRYCDFIDNAAKCPHFYDNGVGGRYFVLT